MTSLLKLTFIVLLRWCLRDLFTIKLLCFPSPTLFFRSTPMDSAHSQRSLGVGVLYIIFSSSREKICLFSLIHLFIQSFVYSSMDLCIFCTMSYSPTPWYLFSCSNCPSHGRRELFQVGSCTLPFFSFFVKYFLPFCYYKMFILYFSCP